MVEPNQKSRPISRNKETNKDTLKPPIQAINKKKRNKLIKLFPTNHPINKKKEVLNRIISILSKIIK